MTIHTIIHFKKKCISCGACVAISPEFWEMDEQGLAELKGSEEKEDHQELLVTDEETRRINQEAADVCPVNIIHVKKEEE
ncbi:MAG: ferredoxin [Nanoarchaeota archaeon]|nr:ferredoxin [Nanoarchaeota archaeon]